VDIFQLAVVLTFGFCLGLFFSYLYWRIRSPVGRFLIKQNEQGEYAYVLELEEEPEGLHRSRYIFLKVARSH